MGVKVKKFRFVSFSKMTGSHDGGHLGFWLFKTPKMAKKSQKEAF